MSGRNPFDLDNDGAQWLYWAYERPSLTFRKRDLDLHDDLGLAIPHGRTALTLLRRVSILDRGHVIHDEATDPSEIASYAVLLPGDRSLLLQIGSAPAWHARDVALELSHRVAGAVLLARREWTRDWW